MNRKFIVSLIACVVTISLVLPFGLSMLKDNKELKDGTYTARVLSENKLGYTPYLTVEVSNGKMVVADFDYINNEGNLLSNDLDYRIKTRKILNTQPDVYKRQLQLEFLKKQSTNIDAVTNASVSTETFKFLANNLISERITKGDTSVLELKYNKSLSFDGDIY